MKDKYREETNKDVYANDMCCGCGGSDGSYSDEYVKWLESEVKKLHIQSVSVSFTDRLFKIAYDYESSVSERMEQIKELLVNKR
jgi:hypothetical protein